MSAYISCEEFYYILETIIDYAESHDKVEILYELHKLKSHFHDRYKEYL